MVLVESSKEMMSIKRELKEKKVGAVLTMGALHNGHLHLIKRAKEECEVVVVSIFVNPTQFLEGEDFLKYPKKIDADLNICKKALVDYLFVPTCEDIYFEDEFKIETPNSLGFVLEGHTRAGHFDGVCAVVLKLLNLISPSCAYFGKKDAQQLIVIQNLIERLFLDIEIVPCETQRDGDGLALSSRNSYLDTHAKKEALKISKALKEATKMIMMGEYRFSTLKKRMESILEPLEILYIELVDRDLKRAETIKKGESIILVAIKVNEVRLIDNIWI